MSLLALIIVLSLVPLLIVDGFGNKALFDYSHISSWVTVEFSDKQWLRMVFYLLVINLYQVCLF